MAKTETLPWSIDDSLTGEAAIAAYLEAALEDGDPQLVAAALGDIARATGRCRANLYKALSPEEHPDQGNRVKRLAGHID